MRTTAPHRDKAASSGRVGSRAFDLMDCMSFFGGQRGKGPLDLSDTGRSRGEQVFDGKIMRGEFGDDATAVEDERAVANLGHFLEVGGNDDDRGAGLQSDIEEAVDLGLRADIDASRRILKDIDLAGKVQPPADDDLLLIAAR